LHVLDVLELLSSPFQGGGRGRATKIFSPRSRALPSLHPTFLSTPFGQSLSLFPSAEQSGGGVFAAGRNCQNISTTPFSASKARFGSSGEVGGQRQLKEPPSMDGNECPTLAPIFLSSLTPFPLHYFYPPPPSSVRSGRGDRHFVSSICNASSFGRAKASSSSFPFSEG